MDRFKMRDEVLVVYNNAEKRAMNLEIAAAMIVNEPQFPKSVHEKAHPRARRAYHLCDSFLTDIGDWSLMHAFLAEVSQQEQNPS